MDRVTMLPFMCEFLAGSIVYWFSIGRLSLLATLGTLIALLGCGARSGDPCVLTAASTALLLTAAAARGRLGSWLASAPFQKLGKISYSLYLMHVPAFLVILGFRTRIPGGESEVVDWILCVVALAGTVTVASVFYAFVERPALHLSHRLALVPRGTKQGECDTGVLKMGTS